MLLNGWRFCLAIVVFQIQVLLLLVSTLQHVSSALVVSLVHLIIFRITHLYMGRTIYISRIRTTRNGTEHMTVEDIYVGKTNHVTLLTATIYEVG